MAFDISVGGGRTVRVNEPTRSMFPQTLGGAFEYSLTHFVYKVLEVMGGALGSFVGGIAVQFFERVEPNLVQYTAPLLDLLLKQEGLDPDIRKFLENLRNPPHEVGSMILSGFAQQAGGQVLSGVLDVLFAPVVRYMNKQLRPARPSVGEIWPMFWRGDITDEERRVWLSELGFPDGIQAAYSQLLRPRLSPGDMAILVRMGKLSYADLEREVTRRGMASTDAKLIYDLSRRFLPVDVALSLFWRGYLSEKDISEILQSQGYTDTDVQGFLTASSIIPGTNDLIRMAVREAFSEDVVRKFGYDEDFPPAFAEWAKKQGLSEDWARRYWRAHWELPSVQLGFEMLHRGIIDQATMATLLRVADYPPFWRDKIMAVSYTPFTRVDVRRMYGLKILDYEGVVRAYKDIGYDDEKARKLADFTVKYEDENGENKREKCRQLSQSVIIKAYKKGILNRQEAFDSLKAIDYEPDDIEILLNIADSERAIDTKPDWQPEYIRDMISIVEQSYIKGLIGGDEATALFRQIGLNDSEIQYRLNALAHALAAKEQDASLKLIGDAYVARCLSLQDTVAELGKLGIPARQQSVLLSQWERERNMRSRKLTEAQYRAIWAAGLIDDAEYLENLRGLGYSEYDLKLMYMLAKKNVQEEEHPTPKPKLLSVQQYMQALKDKVITRDQFVMQLKQLGYQDADIRILMFYAEQEE